jgi:nitrite reductase/ring-hydroxylating ferredoxin subunit
LEYDVTTGSTLASPGYGVAAYPVKIVDGKILVAVAWTIQMSISLSIGL